MLFFIESTLRKEENILKKFFQKKVKNLNHFKEGCIALKDEIAPSYINVKNPKFIEIDNYYYAGLIISNYNRNVSDLILKKLIDTNINMNISLFYEKQDTYKTIRDLTYHIGNVSVDLQTIQKNRQDIDIAAFTYDDAKYIRREMQVNNEDLYFLYTYITIFSQNQKELKYLLNKAEGICQSIGMQTKIANFRQEQTFIACNPYMIQSEDIKVTAKRNVLSSSLVATYPFISSSIFDESGIFIGTNIYNDSLVFIDRYNKEKYKNANMCVFGTSGAGKSFSMKLQILRYRMMGLEQYVIDPDREYEKICQTLDGTILKLGPSSQTYINVMDIRQESMEENAGYLATKIRKLIGFFHLIFGNLDEEETAILEEKIIQCYQEKEITFDDQSLYKKETGKIRINPVFKESSDMPKLEDLYRILGQDIRTKHLQTKLIPFIKGSMKFFNQYTNVKLENKLIIADVYELGEDNLKYGMYIFTELFWDKIKKDRNSRKAIYMDEIWRLIGVTSNKEVASFIYKIFKTIRKYGGSAVAITQDISDLFSLEKGTYGKSILNNSSIKMFFSLEEENIMLLEKYTTLSEKEKIEIKSLKRGECLLFAGSDHILTKIETDDNEKLFIQ